MRRVVLASTTAVYGSGPGDPAVFAEGMTPVRDLPRGPARDAAEIEGRARALARRRPDVAVSVLRLAGVVGPSADSWLTRYLSLPVVPLALGFDPRLQLVHELDAVAALHRAALAGRAGVVNVAGPGVVLLTQALRRARRPVLPVPALGLLARLTRPVGLVVEHPAYLCFGRVVETDRLRERLDLEARFSTADALAAFFAADPTAWEVVS